MIPLFNLSTQYKRVKREVNVAVGRVLSSGWYILGKEVESFEREFAKYLGVKYAVGVASGTDALKIAIKALGLKSDDEVILPANVYPTAFGVAEGGVSIRLVDVDPETYNIDYQKIESTITKKTKAIVVVHLYGQPADMDPILAIAQKYRLKIIEDCAQAHGTKYNGEKVGTMGNVGCFSFYPTKPLGAYGDGGMIVTNSQEIYKKTMLLRMYGEKERYRSIILGDNSRLDELQAAILRVKLRYLEKWNGERRKKVYLLKKQLSEIKDIILPKEEFDHIYHLFVIRSYLRNDLKDFLFKRNIVTGIHYPTPIHLLKSFATLSYKKNDFPVAERLSQEVLSLPIYAEIKANEISTISKSIKEFYKKDKQVIIKE